MKKKLLAIALLSVLCLFFAGCGNSTTSSDNLLKRNMSIAIGQKCSTLWFDFVIESVQEVSEYKGYRAPWGYKLLDITISQTSTFDEADVPLGTYDFYVDSYEYEEYLWPLEAFDSSMMPEDFYLSYGESSRYHMIYEIPNNSQAPILIYTEISEADKEGISFILDL